MASILFSPDKLREHNFSGLAVIVANDYMTSAKWGTLKGTLVDGNLLAGALKRFNFSVSFLTNVTCNELQSVVRDIASLPYATVKDYSCIMFIFAGHGNDKDEIVLQDEISVNPWECIIKPLLPKSCVGLGSIPKIFLIDACRGDCKTRTTLVPRGSEYADLEVATPGECVEQRGAKLIEDYSVPDEGNFLRGWSTMPRHKAYEDGNKGGIWFSMLAKFLLELKSEMSIDNILTNVNSYIQEQMQNSHHPQQPEWLSRLNKVVYLRPEDWVVSPPGAIFHQVVCQQTPTGETRLLYLLIYDFLQTGFAASQQLTPYVLFLGRFLTSSGMQVKYETYSFVIKESGDVLGYQGIVYLCSPSQLLGQWRSNLCRTVEDACEEVARNAYTSLTQKTERQQHVVPDQASSATTSAHDCCVGGTMSAAQVSPVSSGYSCVQGSQSSSGNVGLVEITPYCSAAGSISYSSHISNPMQSRQLTESRPLPILSNPPPVLSNPPPVLSSPLPVLSSPSPVLSSPLPVLSSQPSSVGTSGPANKQPQQTTSAAPNQNYRSLFHEYCQKEGLKPRYDFIEEETDSGIMYKCTVSFMHNGRTASFDSQGFYLRKDDAKEVACCNALKKVNQQVQSRGPVSDSVSYKSKLKEFYDKRGEPNTPLQYNTSSVGGPGNPKFESSIFIKELRGTVKGFPAKSKKETEQSAAQNALDLLRKNKFF